MALSDFDRGRPSRSMMGQPDFEQAVQYALGRLERELSLKLCYHSLEHTRDDVVPASAVTLPPYNKATRPTSNVNLVRH